MNENNETREIDIKGLMFLTLNRWRTIVLGAIIFSLFLGGYKSINEYNFMYSQELNDAREYEYKNQLLKYESDKATIQKELNNLTSNLEQQSTYNNNSLLMQINPYDVQVANVTYYVDANYQIMPELMYQNADITTSIIDSYVTTAQKGKMYQYIIDNLSYNIDIKYLKEVIEINSNTDNHMIYIQIKYNDKDRCSELLGLVKQYFEQERQNIENIVGEHTLSIIDETIQTEVDFELAIKQKTYIELTSEYNDIIIEKTKELAALAVPTEMVLSWSYIFNIMIKYACVGFAVGVFLMIFLIIAQILFNGKLLSIKELRLKHNLKILGVMSSTNNKRVFGFVDTWIRILEGSPKEKISDYDSIDKVYTSLRAFMKNQFMEYKGLRIVVTGTIGESELNNIIEKMKMHDKNMDFQFVSGKDICFSASTTEKIAESDAVIIVEKIGVSTISRISNEINFIHDLEKQIIGAIIL